ncbi:MAG TPA: hypothetical protein VM471_11955, partial [Phenylobacterium sp.]|nr:hypothetical protein [Phenylobacterium sp.]
MSGESTHPHAAQTATTLVLGLGQTIAFASSFYLLGVLGDAIAADLALNSIFVFSLMSLALAVTPLVATRAARWIERRGGKEELLAGFGLTPAKAAAVADLVGVASVSVRFAEFTVMRRFSPLIGMRVATVMHPLGAACLLTLGARGASANYAYRSALLSRPAQLVQIGGPALYGFAL